MNSRAGKARGRLLTSIGVLALVMAGCDRAQEDHAAESASQAVRSANQALNKAEAVAREGLGQARDLARKAGDAARDGAQASGRLLNQGGLTARVKMALLADESVPGSSIDVDSGDDGVVTLTGRLSDPAQVERALEIARGVDGVKRVESRLTAGQAG